MKVLQAHQVDLLQYTSVWHGCTAQSLMQWMKLHCIRRAQAKCDGVFSRDSLFAKVYAYMP